MLADEKSALSRHLKSIASAQSDLLREIATQRAVLDKEIQAANVSSDEAASATMRTVMEEFDAAADEEVAAADERVRSLLELTLRLLQTLEDASNGDEDEDGEDCDGEDGGGTTPIRRRGSGGSVGLLDGARDGHGGAGGRASRRQPASRRSLAVASAATASNGDRCWGAGDSDGDEGLRDEAMEGCQVTAGSMELVYEL